MTSSCGSFAVNDEKSCVSPGVADAWPTSACATVASWPIEPPLWSSNSYWNPPNAPMPLIGGGMNGMMIAPGIELSAPNRLADDRVGRVFLAGPLIERLQPDEQDAAVRARAREAETARPRTKLSISGIVLRIFSACF